MLGAKLQVGGVEWRLAVGAGWMIDEVERGRKRKCVKLKKSQELAKGQNVQRDELESGKNSVRTKVKKTKNALGLKSQEHTKGRMYKEMH